MQLKLDLPSWRQQDDLFYLGTINKESHQQVINKLKERLFSLYLHGKTNGKKNYDDTSIGRRTHKVDYGMPINWDSKIKII